jgi:hypothetical protein
MVLLAKTHRGIQEEQTADDSEVNPVLQTSGEQSCTLYKQKLG